jgi:uncharacterized membrane protein YccC
MPTADERAPRPWLTPLQSAVRAAIVVPAVLAGTDLVFQNGQTPLYATFGSIAMLVLASFTGPPRIRFVAHVAVACAGAVFVVLGTLFSQDPWLAASAMAVVGFIVLFAGVLNGYVAAAATPALLAFLLPVTLPAPVSDLPDRLLGWAIASIAAIAAQMLIWPPPERDELRRDAARASTALADLADRQLAGDRAGIDDRVGAARTAVGGLRRRFLATPHRPTGPTGRAAALASLVDELDWLLGALVPGDDAPATEWSPKENADVMATSITVLRAAAARLEGQDARVDLARLDAAREAAARAVARTISEPANLPDDDALEAALEPVARARAISSSVHQVAVQALLASGAPAAEEGHDDPAAETAIGRADRWPRHAGRVLAEHATTQSVWFRNSLRGAAGLTIAVFIAQQAGLQHGFWVALGTLSVLRSSALGTGSSIVRALVGTTVGILVGVALIIGIGTNEPVLWVVFPVAVLLAGFATRALPFAAGQVAFTVVVLVLFDLIQPSGLSVGLVRIEDVAIGCAVSLGVGILFWPRGASALLRESLASAYARGADYVAVAVRQLVHVGGPARSDGPAQAAGAAMAAGAAIESLDDTFRQSLAERTPGRLNLEDVATLVDGAERLWRAGQSVTALGPVPAGGDLERCGADLDHEVDALRSWYIELGDALVHRAAIPAPHVRDAAGHARLLECVRHAMAQRDGAKIDRALALLSASRHLDGLWRLESHLGQHPVQPWSAT